MPANTVPSDRRPGGVALRNLLGFLAAPVALVLTLPAAVAAAPFLLVGAASRLLARLLRPETAEWDEPIRFDPEIGWMPHPNLDVYHRDLNGDTYRIRTDASGWRGHRRTIAESHVVVFGDSFAFGNAISDRFFFANLPGEVRIKAVGAPGYNMVQSLLLMERYAPELTGKLVVWLVYPGNDLEDNVRPNMDRYRAPFLRWDHRAERWEVVTRHVCPEEWSFPSRRTNFETFVEICCPSSHLGRRVFSACEYLIGRAKRLSDRVGARLAVVTVPDLSTLVQGQIAGVLAGPQAPAEKFDPQLPDHRLGEICSGLGIPFVPLQRHLTEADYRERDVHWTPRGHRRVAQVLRQLHGSLALPEQVVEARMPAEETHGIQVVASTSGAT